MSEHHPPEPGEQPPGASQPTYEPYAAPQYGPPQPQAPGYGYPARPDHPQARS